MLPFENPGMGLCLSKDFKYVDALKLLYKIT